MSFEAPVPDLKKLLTAWEEWERGEEMPGKVLANMKTAGFPAVLPSLFGEPGRDMSTPYILKSIVPGCVSKEFSAFALRRTSPITAWLRALGEQELAGGRFER